MAALRGSAGQANYAAGNASLDSLARGRGAAGLAVSFVQLPLVGGAGIGAAAFDERQMRYKGMAAISLEQYASCLGSVLGLAVGLVASPLPWGADRLSESVADASQPAFSELLGEEAACKAPQAAAVVAEGPLAAALAALGALRATGVAALGAAAPGGVRWSAGARGAGGLSDERERGGDEVEERGERAAAPRRVPPRSRESGAATKRSYGRPSGLGPRGRGCHGIARMTGAPPTPRRGDALHVSSLKSRRTSAGNTPSNTLTPVVTEC